MTETVSEKKGFKIETLALRAYTMLGALALIWIYFHWKTDGKFVTPENLSNLMTQTSVTGIIAVGMLMVIIAGQIDLSVGSLLGLAGAISAIFLTNLGYGIVPAIVAAIAVGIAVGFLQGSLTAYFNIPAFIVTLGGLLAWRGVVKGITNSSTVPISDQSFIDIGQSYLDPTVGWALAMVTVVFVLLMAYRRAMAQKEYGLGEGSVGTAMMRSIFPITAILAFIYVMNSYAGIPNPVLIFVLVAIIGFFITNNTTFGRYLYAVGGNAEAARLSGINNKVVILKVFAFLGALVGLAAIVNTARLGSATVDAGALKELDAIAACVIGGTSLMGGRGTVFGACLGALIMASLDNGMSSINLESYLQDIIKGVILVAAVGLDMIGKKP
ncbi:MAG: sugar ABC transporter permease [Pyrinomonadaceae bacterium]